MKTRTMISLAAAALALAACGDDDDAASDATVAPVATTATAPATTEAAPATTASPVTTAPPATSAPDDSAATEEAGGSTTADASGEYCALAEEIFNQESPPTPEQLTRAGELAPAEIADAAAVVVPALTAAGDDMVAFFAAYAEDDVEQAVEAIDAYEADACGIPHEPTTPPDGATRELEPDAARVDIVATDYAFDVPPVVPGRTSFVLTNQGHEAHFALIAKLAEGVTLQQALESEDESMIEGMWDTGLAAPGGTDEETITFDVEPGNYAVVCFVAGPDGTPHAFMGMQAEFTVT